jgi:formylglycine-generating enzyme required for sulfatase activity
MVVIPPGEFQMGSPEGVGDPNEHPAHKVKIERAFAVGRFEVTWDDWDACVFMRVCPVIGPAEFGRGSEPAINVSWDDAKIYVAWLSRMTGANYRLLSEAEWEYAARGVTNADPPYPAFPWGDKASHDFANYGDDACCKGKKEGRDQWDGTAPVGQFPPNAFGLQDMLGNVWEWVEDPAHPSYKGAPTDGGVWHETGDETHRIVRGGSWTSSPEYMRLATREQDGTLIRDRGLGFRVARDIAR